MTKKIVAVVGEYTNQQGEKKAEFCDIGIINFSQNGKEYCLLDPAVSLSGVLAKQNALAAKRGEEPKNMIMCSVFEKQQNQTQQGGYIQQPAQANHAPQQRPAPQPNRPAPSNYQNVPHATQGYQQPPQTNYANDFDDIPLD